MNAQTFNPPTHPLVLELWQAIEGKRVAGQATTNRQLLQLFWDAVEEQGTPLLHHVDGTTRATFLYREEIEDLIDHDRANRRVTAAWSGSYTSGYEGQDIGLSLMPRSNLWWAEVDLPENFTGMYTFEVHNHEGLITEDIHEPWAMSFDDQYNRYPTQEGDSAYPRFVVTTKAREGVVREGTTSVVEVPADLLPLPKRVIHSRSQRQAVPHPDIYPVWTYTPHPIHVGQGVVVPLVVLMAGQFHESMNLESQLDQAISEGNVPPVRVWSPGDFRGGFKAWGWRNGYGPGEVSGFFLESLLPPTSDVPPVHLLGWAYTTFSTVETAIRIPERVGSLILLDPVALSPGRYRPGEWDVEVAFKELAQVAPNLTVAIGESPDRGQSSFAWRYRHTDRFAAAASQAGLEVRTFEVSDPNIVAEGEAIPAGIAAALHAPTGQSSGNVRRGDQQQSAE